MVDPPYRTKNMMPGMIMLWYGTADNVPSGWHICDGTMDTPDLGSRFVLGASNGYPPGSRAGCKNHYHFFTGNGHKHTIPEGTGLMAGTDYALETSTDEAGGETGTSFAWPYYHALYYIMKL